MSCPCQFCKEPIQDPTSAHGRAVGVIRAAHAGPLGHQSPAGTVALIEIAIAEARAAGYADGIERALKIAHAGVVEAHRPMSTIDRLATGWTIDHDSGAIKAAERIEMDIRAAKEEL